MVGKVNEFIDFQPGLADNPPVHLLAQLVLVVCAVVVTVAVIPALIAARRAAERADRILALIERDIGPLVAQVHGLTEDARALVQEAKDEVARVGAITDRVREFSDRASGALTAVVGLTRAGQLLGLAAGLRSGIGVFLRRLRKP